MSNSRVMRERKCSRLVSFSDFKGSDNEDSDFSESGSEFVPEENESIQTNNELDEVSVEHSFPPILTVTMLCIVKTITNIVLEC